MGVVINPMTPLVVSICLSASLFALTLSTISLVFHWIKSKNNPDISEVWTRLQSVQTQHLDLLDKVEHWRRRDNVRNARQKAEDKVAEPGTATSPAEYKSALRSKATAIGLGVR